MAASRIQLLLPPLRHWPQPWPRRIALALGRANRLSGLDGAAFDLPPSAALSRLGEGDLDIDDIGAHRWLRADPAWIRPDINGARLYALGPMLPLAREDADAFLATLQTLFDDAGYQLQAPTPHRWYLRLPRKAVLPRFATPATALGADPFDHQPEGDGARKWRVLDNEVQIALHQHPCNAGRQRAGLPPINAVWWWGDADLPDASVGPIPAIHSDDPLLRGLARLANMQPKATQTGWPAHPEGLFDVRAAPRDALFAQWLQPALAAVEKGTPMQWICEDGPAFALNRAHKWRFWCKPWQAASVDGNDGT